MNQGRVLGVSVGVPLSTPLVAVDGPSPSGQGHDVAQVGETLVGAVPQTSMLVTIPLGQLRVDTRLQPRCGGLVADHLERLLSSDPGTWPPLLVRPVGRGYLVLDGAHRLAVARRLQLSALPCRVVQAGSYLEAAEANMRHGLPLSRADRKVLAVTLHHHFPSLSERELSRRCGLARGTVAKVLRSGAPQRRGGHNGQRAVDPMGKLLKVLSQVIDDPGSFNPHQEVERLSKALARTPQQQRLAIARALDGLGRACAMAARPYLQ
jgi:hypothetical protein